jgi:hypothetical protein
LSPNELNYYTAPTSKSNKKKKRLRYNLGMFTQASLLKLKAVRVRHKIIPAAGKYSFIFLARLCKQKYFTLNYHLAVLREAAPLMN